MAQQVRLPLAMLFQALTALLQSQFLANELGKSAGDGPCVWTLATPGGYPDEVTGSWLWLGSDMTDVAIQGVNQWAEDSFPLCLAAIQKKKRKNLKNQPARNWDN